MFHFVFSFLLLVSAADKNTNAKKKKNLLSFSNIDKPSKENNLFQSNEIVSLIDNSEFSIAVKRNANLWLTQFNLVWHTRNG